MNTLPLYQLLVATDFNIDTAIAANCAIGDKNNNRLLRDICEEYSLVRAVNDAINKNESLTFDYQIHSFNDGNNIFDEYLTITIEGNFVSIREFNTSYNQEGSLFNTAKDFDILTGLVNSLSLKHLNGSVSFLAAILISGLITEDQFTILVNQL